MSTDLKPCPLCGKPARVFAGSSVGCTASVYDCGASVPMLSGGANDAALTADAVERWNKRRAPRKPKGGK